MLHRHFREEIDKRKETEEIYATVKFSKIFLHKEFDGSGSEVDIVKGMTTKNAR
jgi:hypothetical protein